MRDFRLQAEHITIPSVSYPVTETVMSTHWAEMLTASHQNLQPEPAIPSMAAMHGTTQMTAGIPTIKQMD